MIFYPGREGTSSLAHCPAQADKLFRRFDETLKPQFMRSPVTVKVHLDVFTKITDAGGIIIDLNLADLPGGDRFIGPVGGRTATPYPNVVDEQGFLRLIAELKNVYAFLMVE